MTIPAVPTAPAEAGFFAKCRYMMKGYGGQLAVMAGLFFIISLMDLIGIGLIGPFVAAVVNGNSVTNLPVVGGLMAAINVTDNKSAMFVFGGTLIAIYALKAILAFAIHRHILSFSFKFRGDIIRRLTNTFVYMPYSFYLERNSAGLIQSIINNSKVLASDLLMPSLRLVSDGTVIAMIFIFLLIIDPISLSITVALVGAGLGLFMLWARPRTVAAGQAVTVSEEQIIKGVTQVIGGIKEVRTLGVESTFIERITVLVRTNSKAMTSFYSLLVLPRYLMETILVVVVIIISLIALMREGGETLLVANLAMFAAAGLRILPALTQLSASLASINYTSYALNYVYNDLVAVDAYQPEPDTALHAAPSQPFTRLEFDGVSFSYPGTQKNALSDISFKLDAGHSIGLIGSSGAGKTTLVDILLGFHPPTSGRILIDGKDLTEYGLSRWRSQIAYLPQDISLIDDTVEANVALGIPPQDVDPQKMAAAISGAQLDQFVARLPQGSKSFIGERGIRISGGEKQRIGLARGLYFDRNVFVLDEATSALDTETEKQIIDVINRLHGQKTLIVIAHRLNTVRVCDNILRLSGGHITAHGSYQDVVEQQGQSAAEPSMRDNTK